MLLASAYARPFFSGRATNRLGSSPYCTESCVWLYLDGLLEHQRNAVVPADSDVIFSTGGLFDALLDLGTEIDNLRARLAEYEI